MTERKPRIETLLDVYLRLPSLYSAASCEAYQSAFKRAAKLTNRQLAQIAADVGEWERIAATIVWAGEFTRGKTPEANERAFNGFVGRISAAIRLAKKAAEPAIVSPGVDAGWDRIAEYVALVENTSDEEGNLVLPNQSSRSIDNLRARLGHVAIGRIDTAAAVAALAALPPDKTQSYRNSVRFLNKLIGDRARHAPIADLLPQAPVGPLPTLRDRPMDWTLCTAEFQADLSRAVGRAIRAPRRQDRFDGRLGRDPVSERRRDTKGRKRPVRNRTIREKAFRSSLSWLARHAYPDRGAVYELSRVEDLLTDGLVADAIARFVARTGGSEFLKSAKATSSLNTYLSDLTTIAKRNGAAEELVWELEDLRFDLADECYAAREMSATREAFVKLIDRDPAVVRAILTGPRVLLKEARRLLARKVLTDHQRTEALHLFMCAAMLAIQLARPLRTRNVHEMLSEGETAEIVKPRRERASAWLDIPKDRVKNRRPLEGRIPDWLWSVISAWMEEGRPTWRKCGQKDDDTAEAGELDGDEPPLPPNDHLFPALQGSGPVSRSLINKAWNRGMARLGLAGLTPHMMRHVGATIYLARHPGGYAVVAALLADKLRTVEQFYARGDGRAAMQLFAEVLVDLDPTLDLKGAA
ncbi:hypothetical protein [Thalassococcus profundi]|uniref:hypothetical protein n=1 Tax=Thalassococcus profundi TaxID=2282382 RepID=UPI00405A4946